MGDWDIYCFLCAGPVGTNTDLDVNEDDDEEEYPFQPIGAIVDLDVYPEDADVDVHPEDHAEHPVQNSNIDLTPDNLAWLANYRVIGENPTTTGLRRCYLSGHAEDSMYGYADVAKGIDPVAPGVSPDDKVDTGIYRENEADDEVGALPVHDCCLRVLQRASVARKLAGGGGFEADDEGFGFRLDGVGNAEESDEHRDEHEQEQGNTIMTDDGAERGLNIDAFFHAMSPKREEYRRSLTIDYGALNYVAEEQYFYLRKRDEMYVLNPYEIPQMELFLKALPLLDSSTNTSPIVTEPEHSGIESSDPFSSDPFSRLSLELLTMIYLNLPQEAVTQAMLSTRSLSRVRTYNWFWHQRMTLDMPWAWEVLELRNDIDFRQAYIQVAKLLNTPIHSEIPALANRRRIWFACEQVLDLYRDYLVANPPPDIEFDTVAQEVRRGAKLGRYFYVASAKDSPETVATMWFPLSKENIQSKKKLVMYWKDGSLAGLKWFASTQSTALGNTTDTDESYEMMIEEDDWIKSLTFHIITYEIREGPHPSERSLVVGVTVKLLSGTEDTLGKTNGDKRLFMPQQGKAVVGMRVELAGGTIFRFGLLESAYSGINNLQEIEEPAVLTRLWAGEVPAFTGLRFDEFSVGYYGMIGHQDLVPFSCLMFGTDKKELVGHHSESFTGISGSHDAISWIVHRRVGDNDISGGVGPEQVESKMRFFAIDGSGGERIIGIETDIGPCITGVRVITNRQRQCIWGSTNNFKLQYHAEHGRHIAGIYCSHGYHSAKTQMTTFSIITAPNHPFDPLQPLPDFEAMKDTRGLPWEPSPPRQNIIETSPTYYGIQAQGERAAFLDFSRPVSRITGLIAAAPDIKTEGLGGFSIVYTNGGIVFCGATTDIQDLYEQNPNNCSMGGLIPNQKELEAKELSHVSNADEARAQTTDFEVGAEQIRQVNIWSAAYLHGIQFVTESGRESPMWGKCGGPPSVVVVAGSFVDGDGQDGDEKMKVAGLKIILGSRRYNRGYADVRPLAVQVMGEREVVA